MTQKSVPVSLVTTGFHDKYNHGSVAKVRETVIVMVRIDLEGIIMRKIAWGLLVFLASLSYVEGGTLVAVGSAKEFVKLQIQVVSSKRTHNYV